MMKQHHKYSRTFFFIALLLSAFIFADFYVASAQSPEDGILLIAKSKKKDDDKKSKKKSDDSDKKTKDALKKYKEAQKEMEKQHWDKAIKKYKEAIGKLPTPGKDYYPYVELGMAYLSVGNVKQADNYCQQSKTYGQAPKATVNQCLATIAQLSTPQNVAEAQPTQAPQPTQPPQPAQPTQAPQPTQPAQPTQAPQPTQADAAPLLVLTSNIPSETEASTITISGKVADDNGVPDVTISRQQSGTRAIIQSERAQMTEEAFSVDVKLEPGPNEFLIEAIDTAGQKATELVAVLRKEPTATGSRGKTPGGGAKDEDGAEPESRELYAVIIGVGDYQDEKIPDLRYTVNDAQGMYDVLTDPQFGGVPEENIQLLLNEEATVSNIKKAIGVWLKRKAREEDTVIIYYAGHGAPEDKETYWVTYDADIESLYASALSNNEISDMIDRIESKRVLTFLDACYSAATVNRSSGTRDIFIEAPLEKFTGEGRVVISASDGQQLSLEMAAYEHGVFTYYLLEALRGEADGLAAEEPDGIIEIEEVWNYVRNQVTETAREQGNDQTPKFQGGLTAGIPLTFDREFLEERALQRQQAVQEKQARLQELFEEGMFEDPADFECAYTMVETGEPDKYIDGLIAGKLSAEMFNKLFQCQN